MLLALAACGKKGPPLAPLRVAPARIDDLAVAKTGEEVLARFTVPSANADKTTPADLVAVEVYAISGKPEDPAGNSLAGPQFVRFGKLVGRVQVAPPETPGETPPDPTQGSVAERARAAAEIAARQAQPAQGSTATVVERLTRDDYTPFVHPDCRAKPPTPPATTVLVRPLGPAPAEELFSRTYIAIGVSRHGTRSPVSNRVVRAAGRCAGTAVRGDGHPRRNQRDDRVDRASRHLPPCAAAGRAGRNRSALAGAGRHPHDL